MKKMILALQAVVGLGVAAAVPASAAVFDLTTSTSHTDGYDGSGNYMIFTGSDGTKARVSAWSLLDNGNGTYSIKRSTVGDYSAGLGVTAPDTGSFYGVGDNGGSNNLHTVDNRGTTDFLIFQFSTAITTSSVTLTPFSIPQTVNKWGQVTSYSTDTDATIGFGNSLANWNSYQDFGSLSALLAAFTSSIDVDSNTGKAVTQSIVDPDGTANNLLLIGASFDNEDGYDGFKVSDLNYSVSRGAVPEPASWAMMISGFGLVGGAMRRRREVQAFAAA